MALLIRQATEADLADILDVFNDALINTTAVYQDVPHTPDMRLQWYNDRVEAGYPVIIAEFDNEFAGFASYGPFRTGSGYRYTAEHSVYIIFKHRGKGIGKALVLELINIARQNGLHTLIAGIDSSIEASIKLHLSLGFTEVAHFKQVGYKFGEWLDLKLFQLML
ncbi:GNAT family N-acetyltransferase [Mucilaginibacter jinjuensis]|uniref:GNAT family N-acetyltransferase n=1 Tax=Mucilaginibacter jinjuensis TaxID=1176721 RepID=A0ABY7T4T9_9SPHI|nr:GNAT family N-acetyltransferase [Mucilaginibacter jinjuensis]WCT10791.1 GNAT family N-acetyltransferase [Mucilaginibacter jinjuensis]